MLAKLQGQRKRPREDRTMTRYLIIQQTARSKSNTRTLNSLWTSSLVPFGECHNRYTHEVVSKIQSQRRRLREMATLRRLPWRPDAKESVAKKLGRQHRLELGPSSNSSHGLSNAYPTPAIDMLGQNLLYMIFYHYEGGCQIRPLTP